jgi:hypothetical protein
VVARTGGPSIQGFEFQVPELDEVELGLEPHVPIVHPSADSVVTLPARQAADEDHWKEAGDFLALPSTDPPYGRIDCSLPIPIEGKPRLVKPDASKPRLLNLHVYESRNERAARKKIEMFNKAELAIFRRVGLSPVFFAETVVGAAMPNPRGRPGIGASGGRQPPAFRVNFAWFFCVFVCPGVPLADPPPLISRKNQGFGSPNRLRPP